MRQLRVIHQITPRESDSFDKYLNEIKKEKLLTMSEEEEITQRIRKGDSSALDKLIRGNLRFVVSVAKQYQNRGLTLLDLINEGNIGLIKAAQKFDETRGFKFISYAVWWIRQSIMYAINQQSRMVRIPQNQSINSFKIHKAINEFEQQNQRNPTIDELVNDTDWTEDQITEAFNIAQSKSLSMDKPFQDGEDNCLLDILIDYDSPSPDKSLVKESLSIAIDDTLSRVLTEREIKIIKMNFGIKEEAKSLEDIALRLKLSRERVRQIKEMAIQKLRMNSESKKLIEFVN